MSISKSIFTLLFLLCCVAVQAQNTNCIFRLDSLSGDTIYRTADVQPMYGEQESDALTYLTKNLQFEREEMDNPFTRIHFLLQVDQQGKLMEAKVIRGGNEEVNAKIVRILKDMKKWTPASCGNKPVCYEWTSSIQIHFRK